MVCKCHSYKHKFISVSEILNQIEVSLKHNRPFSLTRFSHAEISCLCYLFNKEIFNVMNQFRSYNGFTGGVKETVKEVLNSMKTTHIAGFIREDDKDNGKFWYGNTNDLFHYLNYIPEKICSVWATHEMIYEKKFWDILKNKKIVIIGRRAKEAIPYFQKNNINVTMALPLEGTKNINKLNNYLLKNNNWDIAILAAGIPATILTPKLASTSGKIAIDFGHALDKLIDGDGFDFSYLYKKWNDKS